MQEQILPLPAIELFEPARIPPLKWGEVVDTNSPTGIQQIGDIVPTQPITGGDPNGPNMSVQFNDGGKLGGDSVFTWNKSTHVLSLPITDTQVLFSDNNAISGDANFTWDKTTDRLTINQSQFNNVQKGIILQAENAISNSNGYVGICSGDNSKDGGYAPAIYLYAGDGTGTNTDGGQIQIFAGIGSGTKDGGEVYILSGTGGSNGNGGDISIETSDGNGIGNGGDVEITCGDGGTTSGRGGDLYLFGGVGGGTGNGGGINLYTGAGGNTNGSGGCLAIMTNVGTGTGWGGMIEIYAGRGGLTSGEGGEVIIESGAGGGTGNGGNFTIFTGWAGLTSGSCGGNMNLTTGYGRGTGTGGDMTLTVGTGGATGTGGLIKFNLATGSTFNISVPNSTSLYAIFNTASIATSSKTITLQNVTSTMALWADKLSIFAATTSAELAGVISDETGSGLLVFATNPTLSGITMADATNIVLNTTTGTKIGTATNQKLGFFNAVPVDQPSAYTQTYTTADKTIAVIATTAITQGSSSVAVTPTQTTPWGFTTEAEAQAIETQLNNVVTDIGNLKMQVDNTITDITDLKQAVNALIDDLQELGLVG